MEQINVELVQSSRSDGILLWDKQSKHLYVKKSTSPVTGLQDWICYQTMLRKTHPELKECTSRLLVDPKKMTATRKTKPHTSHENHEFIFKDLASRTKINHDCVQLKELCKGLSIDIRAGDIFTREMAKLVHIFVYCIVQYNKNVLFLYMYENDHLYFCLVRPFI